MGFHENEITKTAFGGTELAARSLAPLIPAELLDQCQIIASRVRELDPTKIRILWLHDLPEDPESAKLRDPGFRNQFHHIVYVSNWQYSQYQRVLGIPYSVDNTVVEVGITPAPITEKPKDKINLIYTSTPQRGLNLLLPVFDKLSEDFPEIHLDVFSSFAIYGWPQKDAEFEPLFDICRKHPKITYHGFQPNEKLRAALNDAHIFSYPSTWAETSCRALVEAMSARLLCVHPNYGALPDTAGGMNLMYQGDTNPQVHMAAFYQALGHGINMVKTHAGLPNHLTAIKSYVDNRFSLALASQNWTNLIKRLVAIYPTEESRKFPPAAIATPSTFKYSVN